MGGRQGENRLGSTQWWISSEACFITRLPEWRSAGKSRPFGAAAEIYGSLIISTNTFPYSTVQYTAPTMLLGCWGPEPFTITLLLHQLFWLQVCDHEFAAAKTRFILRMNNYYSSKVFSHLKKLKVSINCPANSNIQKQNFYGTRTNKEGCHCRKVCGVKMCV